MKQHLACLALLLPTLLAAQNPNIFDVFYDHSTTHCHTLQADTIWAGGKGAVMKRLAPSGELLAVWDGNNSPLRHDVVDIAPQSGTRRLWLALSEGGGVALKDGESWQTWTVAEVLGDTGKYTREVRSIGMDAEGRAWAADWSNRRMTRYENGTWERVGLTQAQVGYVKSFINDPQGNLWWVNWEGVHGYVNGLLTHRTVAGTGIADAKFRADGQLLVATADGRVLRFLPSGTPILMAKWSDGFSNSSCKLGLDAGGAVYIATGYQILKLTGTGWQSTAFKIEPSSYPPNHLSIDAQSNVWLSYPNSSTYLFRLSGDKVQPMLSGIIGGRVQRDATGQHIWFGRGYGVLTRHRVADGQNTHFEIAPDEYNYGLAPAHTEGQMWMATGKGLWHFNGTEWTLLPDPTPNVSQHLYSVATGSEGEVLSFGIKGTGIDLVKIYRPATQIWEHYPMGQNGVPSRINWTPFYGKNGQLWFPGWTGLHRYDKGQWTSLTPANSGMPYPDWYRVAATPDGHVWASRRDSIYRYDGITWSFVLKVPCATPNSNWAYLSDLFVDSRGWLWATKECGNLSLYDGTEWRHFNPQTSNMPPNTSSEIVEDAEGNLWLGSSPVLRLRTKTLVGATEPSLAASPNLRIWPNPAAQTLHLELPPSASGLLELCDVQGRTVLKKTIAEATGPLVQMERDGLPAGLYFLRFMEKSGRQFFQKIIFE